MTPALPTPAVTSELSLVKRSTTEQSRLLMMPIQGKRIFAASALASLRLRTPSFR